MSDRKSLSNQEPKNDGNCFKVHFIFSHHHTKTMFSNFTEFVILDLNSKKVNSWLKDV